jgi:hypothetical protein
VAKQRGEGGYSLYAAKAALTATELIDRLPKVFRAEIRPELGREEEFSVRGLPEQEVADAMFAGRTDDEIGIRKVMREEMCLHRSLVDLLRWDAAGHKAADRRQHLLAPAVVERERQDQPIIPRSLGYGTKDGLLQFGSQSMQAANVT